MYSLIRWIFFNQLVILSSIFIEIKSSATNSHISNVDSTYTQNSGSLIRSLTKFELYE